MIITYLEIDEELLSILDIKVERCPNLGLPTRQIDGLEASDDVLDSVIVVRLLSLPQLDHHLLQRDGLLDLPGQVHRPLRHHGHGLHLPVEQLQQVGRAGGHRHVRRSDGGSLGVMDPTLGRAVGVLKWSDMTIDYHKGIPTLP